jgi:hypothetical protein
MYGISDGDPVRRHADVMEAASLHANTMEAFLLGAYEPTMPLWSGRWPHLSSFVNMENLVELNIKYSALMGNSRGQYASPGLKRDPTWPGYSESLHDLLPPSLFTLYLHYERSTMTRDVNYTQQLEDLLRDGSSRHSKLESIHITYEHDVPEAPFPLALASLERYFEERGVYFRYEIKYHMTDGGTFYNSICMISQR